jgi:hypothetical protein
MRANPQPFTVEQAHEVTHAHGPDITANLIHTRHEYILAALQA